MKIASQYYKYLTAYSPRLLRKYQTGIYYDVGRSSKWKDMVMLTASNSMGEENEISASYKPPTWWITFVTRSVYLLTLYYLLYYIGFFELKLGVFYMNETNHRNLPAGSTELINKYEGMYRMYRPTRV